MTILFSVIAAFAVMFASLVGVIFSSRQLGNWMKSRLTYLATFSAGVLAVLAYHLIEEAFHEAASIPLVAGSIVIGVVALEIVHGLIPNAHHHHGEPDHTHSAIDGRRVLLSDAVHNITDGFLIVSAFVTDWRIGIGATIGIMLHETVQEISEYFVLKHAGYSNRQALIYNFASSSSILIGVAIAFILASSETLLSVLAALAAGGFLSVVIRDLVPDAVQSARTRGTWMQHVFALAIGVALMFALTVAIPHDEPGAGDTVNAVVIH
jgi:zinc and cadmium transporter